MRKHSKGKMYRKSQMYGAPNSVCFTIFFNDNSQIKILVIYADNFNFLFYDSMSEKGSGRHNIMSRR